MVWGEFFVCSFVFVSLFCFFIDFFVCLFWLLFLFFVDAWFCHCLLVLFFNISLPQLSPIFNARDIRQFTHKV